MITKTKLALGTVILGSALLAGCANSDVKSNKQLTAEMDSVRAEAQAAKDAAQRANKRIDNQVRGYKK